MEQGPHHSAKEYAPFVHEKFVDFVKKQCWAILPYCVVWRLKRLRLSPLGAVPQQDQQPRLIVDLSFFMVNQECIPIAPIESMQFRRAVQQSYNGSLTSTRATGLCMSQRSTSLTYFTGFSFPHGLFHNLECYFLPCLVNPQLLSCWCSQEWVGSIYLLTFLPSPRLRRTS